MNYSDRTFWQPRLQQKVPYFSQKKYHHNYFYSKIIFRALCSQVIFASQSSNLLFRFPFWTFIFVQNRKKKFQFGK